MGYAKRKRQRKALENISNESNTKLLNIEGKKTRPNEEHGLSRPNEEHGLSRPNEEHELSRPNEEHELSRPNEEHGLSRPNEEHGLSIAIEYLTNTGLFPKHAINPEEVIIANNINFLIELDGLDFYHRKRIGSFDWGRLQIFKAISQRLLNDEKMFKEDFKFMTNNVKNAALKMYEIENMAGLHDPLIWLFIPKSWQRWVDGCFDGVGEWRA